ncbi:MAG TPA: TonB-dependent receptor [Steroidobacteraceae bacterium]|nr:TonB-dependent receptor [Steroidobacteraceae bacterium]
MRPNRELSLAVKRALATGTMALIGAGGMLAHAQPPTTAQVTTTPVAATKAPTTKPTKGKVTPAKASTAKAPILLAAAAGPQTTPQTSVALPSNAPTETLQTVVVTGSLIQRENFRTPNPVQVISAKSFTQTGFTSFDEVLKNISSNGQGTLGQSFSFAFAGGGSGIALHGLTVGDTLVLIDGQRSVPYPLLDDNERDFVDVSAFPLFAVDRVEVLSSGGSSLYGGDAIAGVVNVILRKTYQGFKATAEAGQTEQRDATMEHFAFIGGHGDLDNDGYNWYVSGEYRHQDQVLADNRHGLWNNLNEGAFGGFNVTPGAPAGSGPGQNPFYPAGSYGFVPFTPNGIIVNPAAPSATDPSVGTNGLPGLTYLPGCNAQGQAAGNCLIPNPRAQLQPPSTRVDLIAKFHMRLSPSWMLGLDASYFDSTSEQVGGVGGAFSLNDSFYPTGYHLFALGPGIQPHEVPTFPIQLTVPANYPGNPYGAPAPFVYEFPELGPGVSTFDTDTERLLASLEGNVAGWHVKATAGAEFSKMILKNFGNTFNFASLQAALNNGYLFGSSGAQATRLFAPVLETRPTSQLDLVNVNASHNLFDLWDGPVKAAIGAEWYKEVHNEHQAAPCQNGLQFCDPVYVIGTQKVSAVYGELDTPIVKQFEIDSTARWDHYDVFGGSVSGDVAGLIHPLADTRFNRWLTVRANWGRAFRPPTAAEGIQSGETFGLGTQNDPALCPNPNNPNAGGNFPATCAFFPTFLIQANPQLRNVHSTNWGAGLVMTPIPEISLSADYFNIKVENDITLGPTTGILRNPVSSSLLFCPLSSSQTCTPSQLVSQQTPVGLEEAELASYVNANNTHTSGLEVELDTQYDAGMLGRFSAEFHWTHLLTYQLIVGGVSYELAGTHGPSGVSGDTGNPKDRATLQANWTKGHLTLSGNVYYTGPFDLTSPDIGVNTCSDGLAFDGLFPGFVAGSTPTSFCAVGHFISTNFYGAYQLTANMEVHASVENAFNRQPPVDYQTYGSGSLFYPYDAAFAQAGALGRFWTVGVTVEF